MVTYTSINVDGQTLLTKFLLSQIRIFSNVSWISEGYLMNLRLEKIIFPWMMDLGGNFTNHVQLFVYYFSGTCAVDI